jgi:hypothetical protein
MTAKEVFGAAVAEALVRWPGGWGKEASMHCIDALWRSETGDPMPKEVADLVGEVVNPSAFRQVLERLGKLTKGPKRAERRTPGWEQYVQ